MLTYQDLILVGENARDIAAFVRKVISEHQSSALYRIAKAADDYDRAQNTTIMQLERTYVTVTGQKAFDPYAPNHRSATNFFHVIITQLNQYLLGNGVSFKRNEDTKDKLGVDFDNRLQEAGEKALSGGVSFGFWNLDHLVVFSVLEFAPLYDEETGALMAGVRWWQIDKGKPFRATLYTPNGYTDFLWRVDPQRALLDDSWVQIDTDLFCKQPRPYILDVRVNEADGEEIVDGRNYPSFPIVPLWANKLHQSELVGLRSKIDAYDMILSGFENDLDNAQIYWIIKGAGGMDDYDLSNFLYRLKTVKAAAPMDGQEVSPVEVNIPHEAREKLLDRLEAQIYKDAMILNPEDIKSGAATATQIRAAYERQNVKTDSFEYCVIDFIHGVLRLMGIEDTPQFVRSAVINQSEEIQAIVMAAPYLGQEYATRRILTILGDGDKAEEVLQQIDKDDMGRLGDIE